MFVYVPAALASSLTDALDNGVASLCAGRSDGWLIAKLKNDLFAPGCEQLLVPLDMSVFHVDFVCDFSAHATVNLLSDEPTPLDEAELDPLYQRLLVWPSAQSCPAGYGAGGCVRATPAKVCLARRRAR
jgi:hypothetical protein